MNVLDLITPMVATEEQEDLRRSLRRLLSTEHDTTVVRRRMEEPRHDDTLWRKLTAEMGLASLTVPEKHGGAGYGLAEQAVVMEELGRALYDGPFLSSAVMAVDALLLSNDEAAQDAYLPAIASGETTATVAYAAESDRWWPHVALPFRAHRAGDGWMVDGTASYVVDGATADIVLAFANSDDGVMVVAIEAGDLVVESVPSLDQTRRLAVVTATEAPGTLVGVVGEGDLVLAGVLDRAAVALGAEQVGVAERSLEMAVDYAKVRQQFGQPIGSFQAIKHLCADMYVAVETSRSAVMFATRALDEASPDGPAAASLVKAWCSEAAFRCAADSLQVHGGIGFTWESDVHLYFKRAEASSLMFGDAVHHRGALADRAAL